MSNIHRLQSNHPMSCYRVGDGRLGGMYARARDKIEHIFWPLPPALGAVIRTVQHSTAVIKQVTRWHLGVTCRHFLARHAGVLHTGGGDLSKLMQKKMELLPSVTNQVPYIQYVLFNTFLSSIVKPISNFSVLCCLACLERYYQAISRCSSTLQKSCNVFPFNQFTSKWGEPTDPKAETALIMPALHYQCSICG